MSVMGRRTLLRTGLAFIAAPAIVRVTSLMPIKPLYTEHISHKLKMNILIIADDSNLYETMEIIIDGRQHYAWKRLKQAVELSDSMLEDKA